MKRWTIIGVFLMLLTACSQVQERKKTRAVYYWSTVLNIDSTKADFLRAHQIGKMYLRYFDVVEDAQGELMPNATLSFEGSVPEGMEVVPTVYIVNNCLQKPLDGLAEKIFTRVMQMSETNDVENVRELQIDCDWTMRTRKKYFEFLKSLRTLAKKCNIEISATIRLHQLSQEAPPVDRGVLMIYNTGDFTDLKTEKPILDIRDVKPYIHALNGYSLPLASAYPLYRWRICFRNGRYVGIIHHEDEFPILPDDSIVVRQPEMEDIMAAKRLVDEHKKECNDEVILFDLNNSNINRFNDDAYEKIFSD